MSDSTGIFDEKRFLSELDAIFSSHRGATDAEPLILQALTDAENAHADAGMLTVLNEAIGFYRSQGRHQDGQWMIQRALELGLKMGITGTEAWTTTLINAATGMRAAKQYDQAEDLYQQALKSAAATFLPTDRRMAALHNNLSMLYSETGRPEQAAVELRKALRILESTSPHPDRDLDIASTHANLALVLLDTPSSAASSDTEIQRTGDRLLEADDHARKALSMYQAAGAEHEPHYASTLAAMGQVSYARKRFGDAVDFYGRALSLIGECYGTDSDSYRVTERNLRDAQHQVETTGTSPRPAAISGLDLSRRYWEEYGKPLVDGRYERFRDRIAVGLVGHGSECYGFDDEISRDHDFGPGFCLWLTPEDHAEIGDALERDYEQLPQSFLGFGPRTPTPRAQGQGRRVGVFDIGDFFESLTGLRHAPSADSPHEWLMLDEPTLSVATNGRVFRDPWGVFSRTRREFMLMPDDVRLSLISRRLGMMAQSGQYNLPRMIRRGDCAAAWLSMSQFVDATASLVFLLNNPASVGYLPYYKWRFAALRRLSKRMGSVLPQVVAELEDIMRLSSTIYRPQVDAKGHATEPDKALHDLVESICSQSVAELKRQGLSDSDETFLEWQRPYVESHIVSTSPILRSLEA